MPRDTGKKEQHKEPIKTMERIVFTEPNYFLSHYYCLFHPIYCATMSKTLTPLNVSKVTSAKKKEERDPRAVFRILRIKPKQSSE